MPPEMVLVIFASLERKRIRALLVESQATGFYFVGKLIDDYESGINRFDKPGEALFGIYSRARLIAIGGLNLDPYSDDAKRGRVRRVYVAAHYRRQGVGRILIQAIIGRAKKNFSQLTLRTTTPEGAAFYESLGFHRTETCGDETTHIMNW